MADVLKDLDDYESFGVHPEVCDRAKAEIERLRTALERISDKSSFDSSLELKQMAREALEK